MNRNPPQLPHWILSNNDDGGVDLRKSIVARGYDRIAETYAAWGSSGATRDGYLDLLESQVPSAASVLDLGCGTGAHATARLASRFEVVAVDLSEQSVRVGKRQLPNVSFLCADIGSVAFAPLSFDAVIAFFSLIHVPREEHAEVLRSVRSWLRPGGWLVLTMGAGAASEGIDDFLGTEMFWSNWDAETNVGLVRDADLDVIEVRDVTDDEDGRPVTHRWVTARRPS